MYHYLFYYFAYTELRYRLIYRDTDIDIMPKNIGIYQNSFHLYIECRIGMFLETISNTEMYGLHRKEAAQHDTPDNSLMDTIQNRPNTPASQGRQPVVPSDRHDNAGDTPTL